MIFPNFSGQHDVPMVTITSKPKQNVSDHSIRPLSNPNIPLCDKPIVMLTGRVHPGETNSSWIMEGILNFLTSDTPEADEIRNHFIFKIGKYLQFQLQTWAAQLGIHNMEISGFFCHSDFT